VGIPVVNCHGGRLCGLDVAALPDARLERHDGAGHFLAFTDPPLALRGFADIPGADG
jgi:hypothetical protein